MAVSSEVPTYAPLKNVKIEKGFLSFIPFLLYSIVTQKTLNFVTIFKSKHHLGCNSTRK
jgi:hypothetical protein